MQVNDLRFFDKDGYPCNYEVDPDGCFVGEVYLQPLSLSLYDNVNLFVLQEKQDGNFYFPELSAGESLLFKWVGDSVQEFFLYDVVDDDSNGYPYINKVNSVTISESVSGVRLPLQLNVAFCPSSESIFERYLNGYVVSAGGSMVKFLNVKFYGEGVGEDERMRVILENFGIRFNRTDSLCIKDYDIKEAYPDWTLVNDIRKQLIINKEEIFPYVGTYIGLKNFVDVLGYKGVLDIREYWKNVNSKSSYFNKYMLVSIADMLDDGKIDNMNMIENNKNIKFDSSFSKSGFLALAYQFDVESGEYDADGLPIMVSTTDMASSEMFYKLHKLKDMLHDTFLPVNVTIKDVIGEWKYFISFKTYVWSDSIEVPVVNLNRELSVKVLPDGAFFQVSDVSSFSKVKYKGDGMLEFPKVSFCDLYDNPPVAPKSINEADIPGMIQAVNDYYTSILPDYGNRIRDNSNEYTDDGMKPIGCPVILSLDVPELRVSELDGINIHHFTDNGDELNILSNSTAETIKYKDMYEIEWTVSHVTSVNNNRKYEFVQRGSVHALRQLPIILPYSGDYNISARVWDFSGNYSYSYNASLVVVNRVAPSVVTAFVANDKTSFMTGDLHNVMVSDFGTSAAYCPRVNVIDIDNGVEVDPNIIDSCIISAELKGAEVYNSETRAWESVVTSTYPFVENLRFGDRKCLRVQDLASFPVGDLYHIRAVDCVMSNDVVPCFYLKGIKAGDKIRVGYHPTHGYPEWVVPVLPPTIPTSLETYCFLLNNGYSGYTNALDYQGNPVIENGVYVYEPVYDYNPGIAMFEFSIYEPNEGASEFRYIIASCRDLTNKGFLPVEVLRLQGDGSYVPEKMMSFDAMDYAVDGVVSAFKESGFGGYELIHAGVPYVDMINGRAMSMDYYVDNKYVDVIDGVQYGGLSMYFVDNFININTCKITNGCVTVPQYKHVFFFINNISSKKRVVWKIIDGSSGSVIATVRNTMCLVWFFDTDGMYDISVDVVDNAGNVHGFYGKNHVCVKDRLGYIEYAEGRLSYRLG
jgi:hypothetical protein